MIQFESVFIILLISSQRCRPSYDKESKHSNVDNEPSKLRVLQVGVLVKAFMNARDKKI